MKMQTTVNLPHLSTRHSTPGKSPQTTRHFSVSAVFLTLCLALPCFSGPVKGFGKIPFGSSESDVISRLIKKYSFKRIHPDSGSYIGPGGIKMNVGSIIQISHFSLGGNYFEVILNFNQNRKFCHFQFEGKRLTAADYQSLVMDDIKFLSKVFEKKLGEPVEKLKIDQAEVEEGYSTLFWRWQREGQEIYTGVGKAGNEYYAKAVVLDMNLFNEPLQFFDQKKLKAVEEAADAF